MKRTNPNIEQLKEDVIEYAEVVNLDHSMPIEVIFDHVIKNNIHRFKSLMSLNSPLRNSLDKMPGLYMSLFRHIFSNEFVCIQEWPHLEKNDHLAFICDRIGSSPTVDSIPVFESLASFLSLDIFYFENNARGDGFAASIEREDIFTTDISPDRLPGSCQRLRIVGPDVAETCIEMLYYTFYTINDTLARCRDDIKVASSMCKLFQCFVPFGLAHGTYYTKKHHTLRHIFIDLVYSAMVHKDRHFLDSLIDAISIVVKSNYDIFWGLFSGLGDQIKTHETMNEAITLFMSMTGGDSFVLVDAKWLIDFIAAYIPPEEKDKKEWYGTIPMGDYHEMPQLSPHYAYKRGENSPPSPLSPQYSPTGAHSPLYPPTPPIRAKPSTLIDGATMRRRLIRSVAIDKEVKEGTMGYKKFLPRLEALLDEKYEDTHFYRTIRSDEHFACLSETMDIIMPSIVKESNAVVVALDKFASLPLEKDSDIMLLVEKLREKLLSAELSDNDFLETMWFSKPTDNIVLKERLIYKRLLLNAAIRESKTLRLSHDFYTLQSRRDVTPQQLLLSCLNCNATAKHKEVLKERLFCSLACQTDNATPRLNGIPLSDKGPTTPFVVEPSLAMHYSDGNMQLNVLTLKKSERLPLQVPHLQTQLFTVKEGSAIVNVYYAQYQAEKTKGELYKSYPLNTGQSLIINASTNHEVVNNGPGLMTLHVVCASRH